MTPARVPYLQGFVCVWQSEHRFTQEVGQALISAPGTGSALASLKLKFHRADLWADHARFVSVSSPAAWSHGGLPCRLVQFEKGCSGSRVAGVGSELPPCQITIGRNRKQIPETIGEKGKQPSLVLSLKQVTCLLCRPRVADELTRRGDLPSPVWTARGGRHSLLGHGESRLFLGFLLAALLYSFS